MHNALSTHFLVKTISVSFAVLVSIVSSKRTWAVKLDFLITPHALTINTYVYLIPLSKLLSSNIFISAQLAIRSSEKENKPEKENKHSTLAHFNRD